MKSKLFLSAGIVLLTSICALCAANAHADGLASNISVDTSGLTAEPGLEIIFILTDGSGLGDANNTATLSNFSFGAGSAGALDTGNTSAGATGNLLAGATLTDSEFTNTFASFFTAGNTLSFDLNLTGNVDSGGTPDFFSFLILNSLGDVIPTADPSGFGNMIAVNIDSANPSIQSYSDLVTVSPVVTVATPEPGAGMLLGAGLLVLALTLARGKS